MRATSRASMPIVLSILKATRNFPHITRSDFNFDSDFYHLGNYDSSTFYAARL
jgi:hypothetical protein